MQTSDSAPGRLARRVFSETLAALDAGRAVERAVSGGGGRLRILGDEFDLSEGGRTVYSIALGKAAAPMAAALDRILGRQLAGGIISAPPLSSEHASQLAARWRVFEGGHPLPNEASLAAAGACFELLRRADEEGALVVFLVSGGGSAMLEWPREPSISLDDLREANRALVSCGASIAEVNVVRRAFSAIKGGGLARLAPRAAQLTLIVSDTREGDEHAVASGPTLAPPTDDARDAREVVKRYDLAARLPAPILSAVERRAHEETATGRAHGAETSNARDEGTPTIHARDDETTNDGARDEKRPAGGARREVSRQPDRDSERGGPPRRHHVLLDNASAVGRAAEVARQLGCAVEIARDISDQHVAEGARLLVSRLLELRARVGGERAVCLVSGGEFACPVRGRGAGGRSSETALRCALELEALGLAAAAPGRAPRLALLFAGTDGLDGNSPAAGALCDETTAARARALGLDPHASLADSDSHSLFDALGDALHTGHTGTNVRDLRILIQEP